MFVTKIVVKTKNGSWKVKLGKGFGDVFVTGSQGLPIYWFPFVFHTKCESMYITCIFQNLVQVFKNCHFTIYSNIFYYF
jgi:hypothetical protein